jgi:uncharacterized membrane protein
MFSKPRLDTLSDGIFAVAMTLLILDVRLPDNVQPDDSSALLQGLADLWPKFFPYVLSFGVLGLRWLATIEIRSRAAFVNRRYANWWLLYLLLITCVPFSTMIIARFAHLAPSIWLYAGHMLLIALVSARLFSLTPDLEPGEHLRHRTMSVSLLVVSALLAIALSFVNARWALAAFALNFATPVFKKLRSAST